MIAKNLSGPCFFWQCSDCDGQLRYLDNAMAHLKLVVGQLEKARDSKT